MIKYFYKALGIIIIIVNIFILRDSIQDFQSREKVEAYVAENQVLSRINFNNGTVQRLLLKYNVDGKEVNTYYNFRGYKIDTGSSIILYVNGEDILFISDFIASFIFSLTAFIASFILIVYVDETGLGFIEKPVVKTINTLD